MMNILTLKSFEYSNLMRKIIFGFCLSVGSYVYADEAPVQKSNELAESVATLADNSVNNGSDPSKLTKLEMAKKMNDRLADLTFVPISGQFLGFNSSDSSLNGTSIYQVSARPTMPLHLGKDYMLVNHVVLPYWNAPNTSISPTGHYVAEHGRQSFLSPMQVMSVITLNKASGWNAGIGPYINVPLMAQYDKQPSFAGVGAAGIIRYSGGAWMNLATIQNAWDIGSKNQYFLLNPSISYNYKSGTSLLTSPYITANFNAPGADLILPLGGGISQIVKIGKLPMQFSASSYYNVIRPSENPNWSARFTMTFILPGVQ